MSRIVVAKGKQRLFLERVKVKTGLSFDQLATKLEISGRTIRDWRREKYHISLEAAQKLSGISGLEMPEVVEILPDYWSVQKAGRIGGQVRNGLHGNPGTPRGRRAGGRRSQLLRRKYPEKYPNVIQRKRIEKPKHSGELAEFVGIMLGDGHLGERQVVITFNKSTDRAYMRFVCQLIQRLFDVRPFAKDREDHSIIGISSVELVNFLASIGLVVGNKVSNQVDVPNWIFYKEEYMRECLRGLIDTDGNIARKNYHAQTLAMQISFCNRSKSLLQSVRRILIELNFTPSKITRWQVHLTRRNEVEQYIREIGFNNEKHMNRYNGYLDDAM